MQAIFASIAVRNAERQKITILGMILFGKSKTLPRRLVIGVILGADRHDEIVRIITAGQEDADESFVIREGSLGHGGIDKPPVADRIGQCRRAECRTCRLPEKIAPCAEVRKVVEVHGKDAGSRRYFWIVNSGDVLIR